MTWPALCAQTDPETCEPHDPREWDDQGTDWAAKLCANCPGRTQCLANALVERPVGQMRAGVWFDDDGRPRSRRYRPRKRAERCADCGKPMRRTKGGVPKGFVRHDSHGACENCAAKRRRAARHSHVHKARHKSQARSTGPVDAGLPIPTQHADSERPATIRRGA